MEYENGDGKDKQIEVLTKDGVRYLTGHVGEIPEEVWHRFPNLVTEGVNQGKLYLVERVLQQWPSELQEDTELDRKLWNLRRGVDRKRYPISVNGVLYDVLHKSDATD